MSYTEHSVPTAGPFSNFWSATPKPVEKKQPKAQPKKAKAPNTRRAAALTKLAELERRVDEARAAVKRAQLSLKRKRQIGNHTLVVGVDTMERSIEQDRKRLEARKEEKMLVETKLSELKANKSVRTSTLENIPG